MKFFMRFFVSVFFLYSVVHLHAVSLDGTSSIVYKDKNFVFHDGDLAKGFVSLRNGFTVLPSEGVRLNIVMPVFSGMDLRTTGSITLENNLELDAGLTLSSGGIINGNGYSLILNGDLVIPELSTLKITSSLAIDGNGYSILVDNFGQILVDSHSTLTLRNLVLKNMQNSSGKPPIAASGADSKISFDNVEFRFNDNFYFDTGSMFVHNDVLYSGESQFFYRSQQPCYIAPRSTLIFDKDSTFFYDPTNTNSALIIQQDKTSAIYLAGATLRTTPTGLALTEGKLFVDNQVKFDVGTKASTVVPTYKNFAYENRATSIDWRRDGEFFAITGYGRSTEHLNIYKIDLLSNDLSLTGSISFGTSVSSRTYTTCAKWSYDGRYLAVCGYGAGSVGEFDNNDNLRIYEFDDGALTFSPVCSVDFGITATVNSVDWGGLDDFYLAVGSKGALPVGGFSNTDNLRVYHLDRINKKLDPVTSYNFGDNVLAASWNFSGQYLAVGGQQTSSLSNLNLFYFDPLEVAQADRLTLIDTQFFSDRIGSSIKALDWTSDSQYLAVGGELQKNDKTLLIYAFNPALLPTSPLSLLTYAAPEATQVYGLRWHPSNQFLLYGGQDWGYKGDENGIYTFHPNADYKLDFIGAANCKVAQGIDIGAWNPNNELVAISRPFAPHTSFRTDINVYYFSRGSINISDGKSYTTNYLTTSGVYGIEWHPGGDYLVVGGQGAALSTDFNNTNEIRLYRFNDVSEKLYPVTSCGYGTRVYVTTWSPDGQYLAVGGYGASNSSGGFSNTDHVRIYKFQNDYLVPVTSIPFGDATNSRVYSISWHPNGKYLAVGGSFSGAVGGFSADNNIRIYSFDGAALSAVTSINLGNNNVSATKLDWSPDGRYLALACLNNSSNIYPDTNTHPTGSGLNGLRIYEFQNYSTLVLKASDLSSFAVASASWSNDNKTLVVSCPYKTAIEATPNMRIYTFNGSTLSLLNSMTWGGNIIPSGIKFSPDGKIISMAGVRDTDWPWKIFGTVRFFDAYECYSPGNYGNQLILDKFPFKGGNVARYQAWETAWRPDSKFVAVGLFNLDSEWDYSLGVYRITHSANISRDDNVGLSLGRYLDLNLLGAADLQVNGILDYATQN